MRLDFLRPLDRHPGPYASVYLATARDAEDAKQAVPLRWRAVRDRLRSAGADTATMNAIEEIVTDPGRAAPGRAAAGTQAEAEVIDPGELTLADGAGALLRFTAA